MLIESSFFFILPAQTNTIDSLKQKLLTVKEDTLILDILSILVNEETDDALWPKYNNEIIKRCEFRLCSKISEREHFVIKKLYANALINSGYLADIKGETKKAIGLYLRGLAMHEKLKNKEGIANVLNNLGLIYSNLGNIPKALECYNRCVRLQEELNNNYGMASIYNNLGLIYDNLGEEQIALSYYFKSEKSYNESKNKSGFASVLINIGTIYKRKKDEKKAIDYYEKGLKMYEKSKDQMGVARSLANIAVIYFDKAGDSGFDDDILISEKYYMRALKIYEHLNDRPGMSALLLNIAGIHRIRKQYQKAIEFSTLSLNIATEIGYPEYIRNSASRLYDLYKTTGDHQKALSYIELFVRMKDSLNNESTKKASIRSQLKHEYEKQAAADSVAHEKESEIKNVELKRQSAEIRAKKNQQYALFGGLALVLMFSVFMFNRWKVTQKQKAVIENQKEIVEEQKKLVEEKQLEILDSIRYAKRIQLAQIPSEKRVSIMLNKTQGHEGK